MSSLIVKVSRISEITPHPNADRLEIAKVRGWYCIVGKGEYKVNDLCMFLPPDTVCTEEMVVKYNLTFLKNGRRIRTLKLRGFISQGLVLPLSEGKWKEDDDLVSYLGVTKWEPPTTGNSYGTRNQTSKKKKNPNFDKYTDIENIKNYNSVFTEEDDVVITEKIHGCLQYDSKIACADGSFRKIKDIVDNKNKINVLGYDLEKRTLVSTPIKNWFKNGKTDRWLKLTFSRSKLNRGNSYGTLKLTPNHLIYCQNKNSYIEAKDIREGDIVITSRTDLKPSYIQKEFLIGKMLGDASKRKDIGRISFSHKQDHYEYLKYCNEILGALFCNTATKTSGYGTKMISSSTVNNLYIEELFKDWYIKGKKEIPSNLRLTPISLAFWYMDDGSCALVESQEPVVNLATCGFNEKSVENLIKALDMIGIRAVKFSSKKNHWRIRLNSEEAHKFFLLIYPYVPKVMQYKLPEYYRKTDGSVLLKTNNLFHRNIIDNKIIKVEEIIESAVRYDIETETHNYIADGIVVHNSNFRCGLLKRENNGLLNWLKTKLFGEYEFVYGSHNVQLREGGYGGVKEGFYEDNVYYKIVRKYKLKEKLEKDTIIYGEIYGEGIQDLTYGLKDIDFKVFDVKRDGKYLDYSDLLAYCSFFELPVVPQLYKGKFNEELLKQHTEGNSTICPFQIREGCVVKPLKEINHRTIGRKILKSINPEYLLREKGTENK